MGMLDDKVAIITGSTKGIGKAIAHEFIRQGAKVVITSSSQGNVEAALLEFPPESVCGCVCNVVSTVDMEQLIVAAIERFGRIDCFINNAGISDPFKSITESDPDIWGKVIDTNLKGTYNGCRAAVNYFLKQNSRGKIINMAGSGSDRFPESGGGTTSGLFLVRIIKSGVMAPFWLMETRSSLLT